jgi:hypothetical protein
MSGTNAPTVAATVTMIADASASINFGFTVPEGALEPTQSTVTFTSDNPAVATAVGGPIQVNNATGAELQPVTIIGGGSAGTTLIHAMIGGVDNSDIQVTTTLRPVISGSFNAGSLVVSDEPYSSPTAPIAS